MLRVFSTAVLLFLCMMLSSSAYAVAEGFYIGIGTGPATNSSGNQNVSLFRCTCPAGCSPCSGSQCTSPVACPFTCNNIPNQFINAVGKPASNQWGSRGFIGYMFNPYFGIELGFNYFSGIHYNYTTPLPTAVPLPSSVPGCPQPQIATNFQACGGARARVRNLDLDLKFSLPIQWADAFGKVGIAGTYTTLSGGLTEPMNKQKNCNPCAKNTTCTNVGVCASNQKNTYIACGDTKYVTKYSPVLAIGASYAFTQSWIGDVSYNLLITGGPAKNVSFLSFSLAYHFVDIYCGQFLC